MKWPPVKSWTKSENIKEYRYFVAINYGGEQEKRWINLVSVLNSEIRLRVTWEELNNNSLWTAGWNEFNEKENNELVVLNEKDIEFSQIDESICLHPSKDSGLDLPPSSNSVREWN